MAAHSRGSDAEPVTRTLVVHAHSAVTHALQKWSDAHGAFMAKFNTLERVVGSAPASLSSRDAWCVLISRVLQVEAHRCGTSWSRS
jgi:hypothetical protein